jgi:hypothetical protein
MTLQEWLTLTGPLFGVIVGSLISAGTTWVAQRNANQRDDARWEREQRNRTYEHRRQAYADFIGAWRSELHEVLSRKRSEGAQLHPDLLDPVWDSLAAVEIYGTEEARTKARAAWGALNELVRGNFGSDSAPLKINPFDALEDFRAIVRHDLSVPE